MIQTENLGLEKYELNDAANLADGYNRSMDLLDEFAGSVNDKFPITSEEIEDGTINTVDIANGAITTNKIATAAVTNDKIATDAVEAENLADGSVTAAAIDTGAVTTDAIDTGAVTTDAIDAAAVTGEKIANGAVTTDAIDAAAVTGEKIANGAVGTDAIDAAAVTGEKIANGAVGITNINLNAIDNIPTQGSNNLVSSDAVYDSVSAINDNLIKQQVNGGYSQVEVVPASQTLNSNATQVYLADNKSYFFATGQVVVGPGTYNATPIPGTPASYGIPIADLGITFEQPLVYNSCGINARRLSSGNGSITNIGRTDLIIGTNGVVYIGSGQNISVQTSEYLYYFLVQSKLTLRQLSINVIGEYE